QAVDAQQAALITSQLHPDRINSPPREALLRKARNIVWSVTDPRNPEAKLVIKQPLRMHLHKRFLDRFKPSKGKRSWNGTQQLLRRGIGAAAPVAYFEKIGDSSLTRNYYICEFVPTDFSVRQLFSAFAEGAHEFMGVSEHEVYRQLSQYLLRMHGRGVHFRDLSGGNVLVRKQKEGALEFLLIDTNRARFYDHPVSMRKRISDLTRICNKLHWNGRLRFMQMYLQPLRREFHFFARFSFHLYDFKVDFKRRFGRKGIRKFIRRTTGKQKPAL
ncbi:MAG TPA: lipopolysaccharide kinase InaA family protein, partial [Methylophilaceae bacterium]|nr:lipopolysaccharide kinase InaA family protein [Methylophilaceae bacterium]